MWRDDFVYDGGDASIASLRLRFDGDCRVGECCVLKEIAAFTMVGEGCYFLKPMVFLTSLMVWPALSLAFSAPRSITVLSNDSLA